MGVLSQTLGVVSACCLLMGTLVHGECETVTDNGIERFSFVSDQQLTIQLMKEINIENYEVTLTLFPTGTGATKTATTTTTTTKPTNNGNQVLEERKDPPSPPTMSYDYTCNVQMSGLLNISCDCPDKFTKFETEMRGELHIKEKDKETCLEMEYNFYIVKDLTVYRQKTDKPEFYSLLQWSKTKTIPSSGNVKCANGPDKFSKDDTAICVNSAENEPDSECIQYIHDGQDLHLKTPFVPQCAMSPYAAQACTIKKTTMNYNDNTINFELEDDAANNDESMLLEESIVDCGKGFHCEFNHTVAESRDLLFVSTGNANGEGDGTGGRSVCFAPISFQDFQVKTFVIFDDTVEVEWKTVEDFSPGDSGNVNRFKAKIEKQIKENPLERTPPFTEARVACTVPHACYIYFIDVEKVTYDIYVQPYMDSTYTQLNDNNIIQVAIPVEDGSTTERLNITSVRPVLRGGAPALSVCFRLGDPPKYDLDHFKVVLISPSGVWTSQVGGFRASEVEEEVEEEGTLVKERTSQKGSDGATTSVYCSPDVLLEEAWSGLEESVRVLVLGEDEEGKRIAGSSDVAIPKVLPEEIRVTRITKTSSPSKGEEGTNTPAYLKFDFEGYDLKEGEQLNLTYFNQCEKPVAQYSASFVGNQEVIFQIDNPEVIAVGAEPVLIFIARKTDTDEPVAAGRVTYAPQDFSSEPLNFIEGEEVTAIRVQPSEAVHIDFSDESCKDSICYFLGATKDDIVTICKKLTDVEYCEETSASDTSSLEESLTMVLTRESASDEVTLTLSDLGDDPDRSIDMVAWVTDKENTTIYSQPGYLCKGEKTNCKQVLATAPDGGSFKVIVTYVTNDAIKSVVKTFLDFNISATQFSNNILEVSWEAQTNANDGNANFVITLSPPEMAENSSVSCGEAGQYTRCKAYFVLKEAGEYVVGISLKEDQKNQVAYRMKMDTLGEELEVTQVNNEAGSPLKLTVFFNNAPANDYHIVVVDTNGKWVSAEGTRSADDDTTEVRSQLEQHGDLELDSNFDIHSDVWVAVRTSEGKSGQANVPLLLLTSLQQVGEDAIEVQWNDLGDSYVIDKTHNVECEKSSLSCHFVLHQPYDSEDASVEVVAKGAVKQKATRVTSLQKLEGMELSTPTLRFDHKVQVCFKDEGTSGSYLLVLEDGDTLLLRENVSDIEIEGDRKCLISPSKFEFGALVSSWVLVTKFEGENAVRTGQADWISLLLSANRYVRAAFNKQKELHVSWHLLEDFTEESVQYRLTVRKPGGVEFEDNFQKYQAALTVEKEGSYTACVKAMVNGIVSEEVCSSIVVLDMNVEAPEIEKPEAFSSGGTAAMISWDSVEDATGYLVQWQDHSAGERQWNNGIVPPMVKGHARPQPLTSGEPNFVMVPPGVLTLEVDVSTSGDWDMCVAAVRDDMFGEEKCNKVWLGTGSDDKPDPPKNLQHSNNHISWEATEGPNIKYFVKWYLTDHPDSIAKSATTSKTSMDFDPEEPGKWSISVFALNQKVASDPRKIEIQIQGITMNVDQVDARSLKVTWWETRPDTKKDNYEYTLTLKNPDGKEVFNKTKECSSTSEDSPCALFAMGIDQGPDKVDVTVERTGVSKTKTITFLKFEEVKVRYQLRSSHNSTIIWSSVKGADMYNVSIFTDTEAPKLVFNQFRTIPTSYQFDTDLSVKGTYSTVQPCKDEHHCGARTGASPNESDDSTFDTAVFGSILAVLCVSLVLVIALVTFRLHKKKAANSSSSSEVELRPRDIPSFGTEPRLQRLQRRAAKGLPGFTEWQ